MDNKEKLEEAKRLYESANADQKYVLESLFPELAGSEDEKVRKALVEMVHDTTGDELWVDYNVHKEEALAWLEKQGQQEEPQVYETEDGEVITYSESEGYKVVEPKFKVGQTIKKEGFNLGFTIVKIEDDFYYNNMGDHFPFTDQDNWELVEQKSVWNEEDEKMVDNILTPLATKCPFEIYQPMYNWLKALKQRIGG